MQDNLCGWNKALRGKPSVLLKGYPLCLDPSPRMVLILHWQGVAAVTRNPLAKARE